MGPFQYMQIVVSDGVQFCQQALVFLFRRGQCPGDDSPVIGCAMLSRVHVGCDCIFGFVPRYIWKEGDYPARLNTTLIGVSISVCCLSVYNLVHFPVGQRA